jgi:hypothetical protein
VILEHSRCHVDDWGDEEPAIRSMRGRLMAYSKNFPEAKALREKFQHVSTVAEIEDVAEHHLTRSGNARPARTSQASPNRTAASGVP